VKLRFGKYTEAQLREVIKESRSIRQSLLKLGVSVKDNTYRAIRRRIDYLDIDTSHFTTSGPAWKRGRRTSIEDYFSNKVKITSHLLRCRLLEDRIFEHKCFNCSRSEWCDQPIPLELNHINGDHNDNSFDNLELLCPNCHALTPHYRGRKNKNQKYKTHCKRGHERTEDNLHSNRGCKICKKNYDKLRRNRKIGQSS